MFSPGILGIIGSQAGRGIPPVLGDNADFFVNIAIGNDAFSGTSATFPKATAQAGANLLTAGKTLSIDSGNYRETITIPASGTSTSPITIRPAPGANVIINGLNVIDSTGWTVHNGTIYKKTISLPATNNYNEYIGGDVGSLNRQDNTSNTQLLGNQLFKDGTMQMHARYPKMYSPEDQLNKATWRKVASITSHGDNQLVDPGLSQFGVSNWSNAWVVWNGWFMTQTRQANGGSGDTINWSTATTGPGPRFRKMYYVTNHLSLLTTDREWHYEGGILYYRQVGGGVPTGLEYKARNWGFNIKDRSYINIQGITFKGCDAVHGNSNTTNCTVDNIKATYSNHGMIAMNIGNGGNTRNASQSGLKLIGANNTLKNSEFKYASSMGMWIGPNCRVENNKFEYITYDGSWGAPFRPWEDSDNFVITKNTTYLTGRGAFELSGDQERNNTGFDFSFNDCSGHNALSIDGGAVYTQLWSNHDGSRIHHNWFHDTGMYNDGTGDQEGIQVTGVYFDQGSGAGPTGTITMDHNVHWNGPEADFYTQTGFEGRDGGHKNIYNCVNAGQGTSQFGSQNASFVTYDASTFPAKQRNNINRGSIINQNNALDNANSLASNVNPLFVGGNLTALKGLYFMPSSTSPTRNAGVVIAGITDGYLETAPDIGAYEYGDPNPWVAGYAAVPYTNPGGTGGGGGGGTGNLASIQSTSPITVAYNTDFNAIGLPPSRTCTFDGGGTGSVAITWSVSTYNQLTPFYTDGVYTLTGTPVTGGGVTNTANLMVSCVVTVKNAFFPLTASIQGVYDFTKLVTNTNNSYGTVDASNNITLIKSVAPSPISRDYESVDTAPKLSANAAQFLGTGYFRQNSDNADLQFMHYPDGMKWIAIIVANVTDTNTTNIGLFGNNGYYAPNTGIAISAANDTTNAKLTLFMTGSAGIVIDIVANGILQNGSNAIYTVRVDDTLADSAKVVLRKGTTQFSTVNSSTAIASTPQANRFTIGDYGSYGSNDMTGSIKMVILMNGVMTDAILDKFIADISAYTGVAL